MNQEVFYIQPRDRHIHRATLIKTNRTNHVIDLDGKRMKVGVKPCGYVGLFFTLQEAEAYLIRLMINDINYDIESLNARVKYLIGLTGGFREFGTIREETKSV